LLQLWSEATSRFIGTSTPLILAVAPAMERSDIPIYWNIHHFNLAVDPAMERSDIPIYRDIHHFNLAVAPAMKRSDIPIYRNIHHLNHSLLTKCLTDYTYITD
jgi:nitrate reductase alpha subunit